MSEKTNKLGGGLNQAYKSSAFEHKHHHEVPLILRRARKRRRVGNSKPMQFCSLHHHTTFSYLDGFQLPEAHIRRAAELNMPAMAATEHGNIFSHVKLEVAAEGTGVKPLYGCELYTGKVGPGATQRKYHLTVLAENAEGYRNLLKLVSLAYAEGFHYEATVSWEWLKRYREGLIIMSGCQGSLLFCSFVGGKLVEPENASYARGKAVMRRFRDTFGDAYYAELQAFPELELTRRANPMIAQAANELGVPLVGTMDCHYTEVEEREMQKILHNIRPGNKQSLEDQAREWGYNAPLCPPPNDRSILRRLEQTGLTRDQALEAVISTGEIAERCNVVLPKLPMVRFPLEGTGCDTAQELWIKWLKEGWSFRGLDKLPAAEQRKYKAQLKKERAIIEEKDFCDYHLVVADAVRFAKDNGVAVGPARGSAAASLACWLLRITEVDPVPYPSMVFERYIDLNRVDLPDIDLDFDSDTRWKVREYMVSKYGGESVSNVGTFSTFKAKMALDDVARVHRIPKYDVSTIKDLLVERSSGDLRASATIEDTILQFDPAREAALANPEIMKACDLEGNVKGFGVHAAGLIISNGPITDVTSVITRSVKGHILKVVGIDKYDAERQGLLKLDFLGLNTMSMITSALAQIGMSLQELYDLPLDDPATIKIFQENDVVGVFQFEGRAMRSVNGALRADNFKEMCDVNALSRPGALHNGSANEYIDIKRGVTKPEKIHPAIDRITESTNYQIVYQEQILRIVREIGDFSWTASAEIRKIISKKVGEQEFNRRWEGFRDGGLKLHEREPGMPPMNVFMLKDIWGKLITAGSYAFNYAHCVSGDSVVIVSAVNGGVNSKELWTIKELWDRMHGLPMREPMGGRWNKFDGPCMRCGEVAEDGVYSRGWCKRCFRWRMKMHHGKGLSILSLWDDGRVRPDRIVDVLHKGNNDVYLLKTDDGREIKATDEHLFKTMDGWKPLRDLEVGEKVANYIGPEYKGYQGHMQFEPGGSAKFRAWRKQVAEECEFCGETEARLEASHKDGNRKHNDWPNLQLLCPKCHRQYDIEVNGAKYGSWANGWLSGWSKIDAIEHAGVEPVYDLVMKKTKNFVANNLVVHNSHSYSLLGYWTAWLKAHHPTAFYAAALDKMGGSTGTGAKIPKEEQLIRDAVRHGIIILPPDPEQSSLTWRALDGRRILAGFTQIDGIGDKVAESIIAYRQEHGLSEWDDLIRIKGIGAKTVAKIKTFVNEEDPFKVLAMDRALRRTAAWIKKQSALPNPTHTAAEVPYERGKDTQIVWLGVVVHRNLRDIFETNRARTGVELKPEEVKRPDLNEFLLAEGYDGDEIVNLRYPRWVYPKFATAIWDIKLGVDLVLIRGVKPGWRTAREIYVREMWVISP